MHKQIFISGIDTDCGKTYITGLIALKLISAGINCITSKIVQTGSTGIADDIIAHRRIMNADLFPEDIEGVTCPMVYSFPASPHLSALIDKQSVDLIKINENIKFLEQKYDIILSEGAGGLCVPLANNIITADYILNNKLPLILVSSSHLGSINHTILSIDYCVNNNLNLRAVVYNSFNTHDVKISASSFSFIQDYIVDKYPGIEVIHSDFLKESSPQLIKRIIERFIKN
ncbi:dethiobiotin synthase [Marinilabiliaceae bacterium ANBcel2]|nr:dethiobiotin synthase [Marinilabiliaceae bacterium ANBcel2]